MLNKINVTIIGSDHYNTYGVVRSLGEKGLKSNVIILGTDTKKSFVLKSKYVKQGSGFLVSTDSIERIIEYAGESNNILICCSDQAVDFITYHNELLKKQYILPICNNPAMMRKVMKKSIITQMANKCGINTPKTWTIVNRQIPDSITYPCITKPETSTSGRKDDLVVCYTQQDLEKVVKDHNRCANYAVQQYIKFEKELSILGTILKDGTVVFSGCIDKIRTCMIGTSSYAKMIDNSILGETKTRLEELLKMTGYHGLFSAEFLLKDGIYYFLEVNFRNDGNSYVATAAGINLPYIWINSYFNITKESSKGNFPCYFMLDIEDFLAIRRNGVSFTEWKHDLYTTNTCLVYNKQDKRPFYKKLSNILLSIAKSKLPFL